MKVYVMRHGTTVWNEKGITQGRTNNRLSQKGKALTQEVATKYKDAGFDVIYSSPLMRTMQTSNLMNKYHNVKIVKDSRLIEIDQGIFTGKMYKTMSEELKALKNKRDSSCKMESYESVYHRAKAFLNDLTNKNHKNVLVITHNVNASLIACILSNINVDFNNKDHLRNFKNAEVKTFKLK